MFFKWELKSHENLSFNFVDSFSTLQQYKNITAKLLHVHGNLKLGEPLPLHKAINAGLIAHFMFKNTIAE